MPKGLSGYEKTTCLTTTTLEELEMRSFLENFMEIVQKVLEKIFAQNSLG